jgi:hypothetical protein
MSAELLRRRSDQVFSKRSYNVYGSKPFWHDENGVETCIWIANAVYVLVAILKKHLNLGMSLYTIREILSLTLLEKRPFYRYRQLSTIQN